MAVGDQLPPVSSQASATVIVARKFAEREFAAATYASTSIVYILPGAIGFARLPSQVNAGGFGERYAGSGHVLLPK